MFGYLLVFGFLNADGVVERAPSLPTYYHETRSSCEEAKDHPAIRSSYAPIILELHPGTEVRIWCEPVKTRATSREE